MIFQALSVSRIYKVFFPGASSLTRGFALSLGCGEHCWLEHIRGRKILIPETLSGTHYCETTPTKISIVPADILESFLLTLAPVVTEHYFL
jgi:hypothetical protein